jgi:ParB-like nuclease domain
MPKVKVSTLKQSPYGFARLGERVDPTRQGVQKAIDEGRFSQKIMDQYYFSDVVDEIVNKTQDPVERDRLMHEYHNERIAELIRTKEAWLDKSDAYPITVNQFNEVIAGNHRFRAIRYLGVAEVEVAISKERASRGFDQVPEIWE